MDIKAAEAQQNKIFKKRVNFLNKNLFKKLTRFLKIDKYETD